MLIGRPGQHYGGPPGRDYVPTGDPSGEEALATGTYGQQQWAGLKRFAAALGWRAATSH